MPTGLENRVNPVETIIAEVMRRSGGADQTTEREIVKDVITPAVTDEEFVEDRSFVPAEGTEMGDVNIPTPLPTTSGFPSDSELVQAIGEEPTITDFGETVDEVVNIPDEGTQGRVSAIMSRFGATPAPEEQLARQTLFPGLDQPIRAGAVQGQVIGTQPIFVGSGAIFPIGLVHARQRALDKAMARKTSLKKKLFENAMVEGAPQYQRQLDNLVWSTTQQAFNDSGGDITRLMDPTSDFARKSQFLKTLAAETKDLDAIVESIIQDAAKGDKFVSKRAMEFATKYQEGKFDLTNWLNSPEEYQKISNELKSHNSMTHYLKANILTELEKEIEPALEGLSLEDYEVIFSNSDADIVRNTIRKVIPEERLKTLARIAKKDGSLAQSEEEIVEYMGAVLADDIQTSDKVIKKWKSMSSQGRTKTSVIPSDKNQRLNIFGGVVKNPDGKQIVTEELVSLPVVNKWNLSGQTNKTKGVSFTMGDEVYDMNEGRVKKETAALSGEVVSIVDLSGDMSDVTEDEETQRKWLFDSEDAYNKKKREGEKITTRRYAVIITDPTIVDNLAQLEKLDDEIKEAEKGGNKDRVKELKQEKTNLEKQPRTEVGSKRTLLVPYKELTQQMSNAGIKITEQGFVNITQEPEQAPVVMNNFTVEGD